MLIFVLASWCAFLGQLQRLKANGFGTSVAST